MAESTDVASSRPSGARAEKNINKAGQMARIAGGVTAIAVGVMAGALDGLWKALPLVNPLVIGDDGVHTGLYPLVQGLAVLVGLLAIVQGASGRCWIRAMGIRTPL